MAAAGGKWSSGGKFVSKSNKGAIRAIKTARRRAR